MSYESSVLNTRYRLDRKVGQGGFAQVFLATDLLLKRRVAIKVLNADLTADPDFLARFEREAQAIAALDHPNILAVYDYGQAHDTAYLVMPYVEGGTLYDRLRQQRALGLPETGEYLRQAAAALDYAHRRGIVHRDIKPQNMLLREEDGRLLLADFGIAKVLSSTTTSQTRTGVMGTIAYMAPEQFQGQVGRATDVYALGCVLFQCVTGQVPYTGLTEQVIYGHVMGPVPSLLERTQGQAPAALQGVVERALAKQPAERFQPAGELVQTFAAAMEGAAPPPGPARGPAPLEPTQAGAPYAPGNPPAAAAYYSAPPPGPAASASEAGAAQPGYGGPHPQPQGYQPPAPATGGPAGGYHQAPTGAPAAPTAARRGPSRALLGGIGGVLAAGAR